MSLPRASLALFSLILSLFLIPESPRAQQTVGPSTQAVQLLRQSLAALVGNTTVTDVTLSGTARRIAGSDDESGTVVFKALAGAGSRLDLSFLSGPRSWVYTLGPNGPAGSWSGPDGVSHPISLHNLLTQPSSLFPAYAVARRLSPTSYVAHYVAHETLSDEAVEHISVTQTDPFPNSSDIPNLRASLASGLLS